MSGALTYAALRNCAELTALVIGGVLVDTIGARGTLVFAGAATAVIGLLGFVVLAPLQSRYTVRREEIPWPSTPSAPPSS